MGSTNTKMIGTLAVLMVIIFGSHELLNAAENVPAANPNIKILAQYPAIMQYLIMGTAAVVIVLGIYEGWRGVVG